VSKRVWSTAAFVAGFALLDAMVNIRYPAPEPAFWYLLPALDVLVIFTYLALFASSGWRVPKGARIALVVGLLFVRFLRLGDGVQEQYYSQPFHLHTDLALLPELVRFGWSSLGPIKAILAALLGMAGVVLVSFACYAALEHAERFFADTRQLAIVAGTAALSCGLVLALRHPIKHGHLYDLGFGASAIPRIKREAKVLLNVVSENAEHAAAIARQQQRLRATPSDLSRLGGADVYLFLVESYGQTVFERADFTRALAPLLRRYEEDLGGRGFSVVSGVLDSPAYGGRSWLAHATIGTGVRVDNQLGYEVVCEKKPAAMPRFFRDAGYRTVLVQPGTTREWPKGEFYGFDQKYYAWNFDYAGPPFAWATMPDQYVVDFVRRRELVGERSQPLFVQYVLVSSHAPWSDLPPVVDDWASLGDGALFHRLERRTYPIEWPDFANASQAYIDSIVYDLDVLERYLRDFVDDESLIIILGDHQPVAEVNGHSAAKGVPVHVLSRRAALLEPFLRRGYTRGMRPRLDGPHAGLDSFLVSFLTDFSAPP
jgi:hypothetical protein